MTGQDKIFERMSRRELWSGATYAAQVLRVELERTIKANPDHNHLGVALVNDELRAVSALSCDAAEVEGSVFWVATDIQQRVGLLSNLSQARSQLTSQLDMAEAFGTHVGVVEVREGVFLYFASNPERFDRDHTHPDIGWVTTSREQFIALHDLFIDGSAEEMATRAELDEIRCQFFDEEDC